MKLSEKRFQECNKIVKIWRYRWYLLIPFQWLDTRIRYQFSKDKNEDDDYIYTGVNLFKLLVGSAQMKMKWYYTSEEVFEKLGIKRYGKRKKRTNDR